MTKLPNDAILWTEPYQKVVHDCIFFSFSSRSEATDIFIVKWEYIEKQNFHLYSAKLST